MKDTVSNSLSKLDKYFQEEPTAKVVCSVDNGLQKVEVTITYRKKLIRSEVVTNDMYQSIDTVTDSLERKIRKYKTKLTRDYKPTILPPVPEEKGNTISIAKEKTYNTKPMYPEDACLELELIGHSFFVFVNAETDTTCAVYKRNDGTYGLMLPGEE